MLKCDSILILINIKYEWMQSSPGHKIALFMPTSSNGKVSAAWDSKVL